MSNVVIFPVTPRARSRAPRRTRACTVWTTLGCYVVLQALALWAVARLELIGWH